MKSPKLWTFSHRVEHLFFCQVPPKKSTVAVLDFGPVGRLRRAWWRGLPVVAVAVAVAGPRWRGGARSVLAMAGHARRGCRRWDFPRETPGWVVMPRNAVKGCHGSGPVGASGNARGRGHRKHPGGGGSGRRWSGRGGKPLRTGIFILKRGCACSIFYFFLKKGVFTLQSKCKINNFKTQVSRWRH